jgi:peptidyl-prolyl cis-trans isomerase-like protein 2
MGKHRHSKDKMHITYTELKEDWGGKKDVKRIPFAKLPFYCCALSLSPFQTPVCTPDGHVYDLVYIMPFLRKFQRCPVTGRPMKPGDLIRMNWTRNEKGEYEDPISYKVFTENTHIVCIKTSGYVYAHETVQELNKKAKYYYDLVTNDPFTPNDIITIQDPSREKALAEFHHVREGLPFVPPDKLQPDIKEN